MRRKFIYAIAILLVLLFSVVVVRTLLFRSKQVLVKPAPRPAVDPAAIERFSKALQIPTISHQEPSSIEPEAFSSFRTFLEQNFPLIHQKLTREVPSENAILFTWAGKDPSAKPILLMSHFDVVPVEPGTESAWKYPAFSGTIAEGFIWGRGALDDKMGVMAILEATELLLQKNYQPARTIYFAFGGDEEIGGVKGAASISNLLRRKKVEFDFVLDEGMVITKDLFPGISAPVAMIGVAEKGYLTLELLVEGEGGHSSMPPKLTSIGILSRAIDRLEANQLPAELVTPVREMFETLGPEMSFTNRMILANLWLFKHHFLTVLQKSPNTDAMLRTTTAPTIFQSGTKENVLPGRARAIVNFRIRPGESVRSVVNHVQRVISDSRVKVSKTILFDEPSPVSNVESPNYRLLQVTIREIFPDTLVAPALLMGATDTKHYRDLSKDIYRFAPILLSPNDLPRVHGTNERVATKNYEDCIRFYRQLILNATVSNSGSSKTVRTERS
jgi:carboxypeptidase PM20D1